MARARVSIRIVRERSQIRRSADETPLFKAGGFIKIIKYIGSNTA